MHHRQVDSARVALLRDVLSSTPWLDNTRAFARALRSSVRTQSGLLLVGTPENEPWHLAAHLDDESRFAGIPELAPVLVRHHVPTGAPAHLSIGLERLESARNGEALFVVAATSAPEPMLDRIDDARHRGAVVLTMHSGDSDLRSLSHESLEIPRTGIAVPTTAAAMLSNALDGTARGALLTDIDATPDSFDIMGHLVSSAIGETALTSPTSHSRRAFRDRLGRLLDSISGAGNNVD